MQHEDLTRSFNLKGTKMNGMNELKWMVNVPLVNHFHDTSAVQILTSLFLKLSDRAGRNLPQKEEHDPCRWCHPRGGCCSLGQNFWSRLDPSWSRPDSLTHRCRIFSRVTIPPARHVHSWWIVRHPLDVEVCCEISQSSGRVRSCRKNGNVPARNRPCCPYEVPKVFYDTRYSKLIF